MNYALTCVLDASFCVPVTPPPTYWGGRAGTGTPRCALTVHTCYQYHSRSVPGGSGGGQDVHLALTTNTSLHSGLLARTITPRPDGVQSRAPLFQYNCVPFHRPHNYHCNRIPDHSTTSRSVYFRASPSLPC